MEMFRLQIPENVVAIPDVVEACKDADFIVFVLPHKFVKPTCSPLVGKIKPTAVGMSLIKGDLNWIPFHD